MECNGTYYIVMLAIMLFLLPLIIVSSLLSSRTLHTRHTKNGPDLRHTPRHEVHQPQPRESNSQTSELLKPSMEVRSRHKQHPPHQARHTKRELDTPRRSIALHLLPLLLHRHTRRLSILQRNQTTISQSLHPRKCRQEFKPQQATSQNQEKDMSANIMSPLPRPTHRLTRRRRNKLPRITHILPLTSIPQPLTLPARKPKHSVDQRRPEEPLRDKNPPRRHRNISRQRIHPAPSHPRAEPRVENQKHEERKRCPEPPDFDKVDVENVLFLRKVRRRVLRDV
jgi:hypothetical protein